MAQIEVFGFNMNQSVYYTLLRMWQMYEREINSIYASRYLATFENLEVLLHRLIATSHRPIYIATGIKGYKIGKYVKRV